MSIKLTSKVQKEIAEYKILLQKANIRFEAVIAFGSQVKGTAKPYSDIDLCVVSNDFGKNRHNELVKLMRLTNAGTVNVEPHPFHPSDLQDKWNPLASEIKKYGIVV